MKLSGNHTLKLTALSIFILSFSQPLLAYAGEANQLRQGLSKNLIEFIFNRNSESEEESANDDSDSERPRRRPTGRTPGADRDDCPATALPLTALIPIYDDEPTLTVSEYPTFWFYIPHQPNEIVAGEFVYTNQNGEQVYRGFFELKNTPGVVNIAIPPESEISLSVDHNYRWFLKLFCDPRDPSSYVFLEGDIKRVDVDEELMTELTSQEDEDYIVYARHEIWHDALTSLGSRLRADETEEVIQDNWRKLLEDVDLGHLADEPVLECCTLEQL
jgi:hypothetical protein